MEEGTRAGEDAAGGTAERSVEKEGRGGGGRSRMPL